MSSLVYFVYDIVPYPESATLQLCRTAAAVGNTIYVRSQMTDSRQHAESTTLQPCRTAAAVGNTIYVRVACPRYAAASCLCRSLSFVTPPYHTFVLYIGTFKNSNSLDTNQPILIHLRPQRQFFNEYFFCFFLRRSPLTDSSRQHAESKTPPPCVAGPCARAVSSPYGGNLLLP